MSCETQNVDVTFNDTTAQSLAFDDATALSLAFDDVVNQNIQCSKFEAAGATTNAPEFAGVTSWDWSAKSLSALADSDPVDSWTDRHSGLAVAGSGSARPTKTTVDGVDAVLGDGVDDQLVAAWSPDLLSGYSVFVVYKNLASVLFEGWIMADLGGASASDSIISLYYANAGMKIVSVTNRASGIQFYESPNVYNAVAKEMVSAIHGTDVNVRGLYNGRNRNDVNATGGAAIPLFNPTRLLLMAGYDERAFDGYVHEIVLYEAPLTEVQRDEVWDFLESEWGGPF